MKKLNFGCGDDIRKDWDNCDEQKEAPTVFNFDHFPYPLKNDYYDYILVSMVIAHVLYPDKMLDELWRASKNEGIIKIVTPHYTNKGAYNDIQHKNYLNELSFQHFADKLDRIDRTTRFTVKSLEVTPTIVGRFMPSCIRDFLSLFINGLNSQINVEYEVNKLQEKIQNEQ